MTLIERGPNLGGLVSSFSIGGTPIERFYHHVFPQEAHVLALIDELGLTDRLEWYPSAVGVYTAGRIWPFTSPLDLLRFGPLPFVDRLATGIGALRLSRTRDWAHLDELPALDWLRSSTSARAADVVWAPLLRAKFGPAAAAVPAAWMWGRFQQRAGARAKGRERLGYLRGGFAQVFEAVDAKLLRLGVTVRTSTSVAAIGCQGDRVTGVTLANGEVVSSDAVVFCGPMAALTALVPSHVADARWSSAGLGVLCVVLEMSAPLTPVYWTNVCDPDVPFGGIIEHTNLVPASDYGRHVIYLSRYFTEDEPIAATDPEVEADRWIDSLERRLPTFARARLLGRHVFRAPYAAPLVSIGHGSRIPPLRAAGLDGLYVATTAQIYPQDRGMSEGVRAGEAAASAVIDDVARIGA